jgi:hypothetical protein
MSWLRKIFGGTPKPRTLLDQVQQTGGKLIVSCYRKLGAQHGCAPTAATSDQEIIEIYKRVVTAFREASQERGEHVPAGTMNNIVWKFIQIKEMMGAEMLDSHLEYELQKYLREGLRPDYRQELHLF